MKEDERRLAAHILVMSAIFLIAVGQKVPT